MSEKNHWRIIIIGSGPAGFTAALYAARADIKPLVFEGIQPGGQLTITTDVENYPGFPKGIMGPEMMDLFREQAKRFGTECVFKEVTEADLSKRPFRLTAGGGEYTCDALILACGASAKLLGLESESRLMGHGVSACATCDGFFFRDKEIAVVGGGDTAMEESTFLTKFASKITVIHRRDELRASKIMRQKAFDNEKIEFLWDSVVTDVMGDPSAQFIDGIQVKNVKTDEESTFNVQGLFMAIGHKPNTDLFVGQVEMNEPGYIITKDNSTYTNIEGVFAAGDIADHVYRQAVTAAGTGCMAAMDAERWLEAQKG